jgi:hypothetical protein
MRVNERKESGSNSNKEDKMRKIMVLSMLLGSLLVLTGPLQVMAAEAVNVTGEIIDTYCYSLMGAKGESHRQCAIDCVKAGIPAGLLEEGTNKVYVLLPNKDKSPLPKAVLEKMARKVTITGKVYTVGGSQFLTIESVK